MIAELRVRGDPHVSPLHCLEEDDDDSLLLLFLVFPTWDNGVNT